MQSYQPFFIADVLCFPPLPADVAAKLAKHTASGVAAAAAPATARVGNCGEGSFGNKQLAPAFAAAGDGDASGSGSSRTVSDDSVSRPSKRKRPA